MNEPRAELEANLEDHRKNLHQYRKGAAVSIGWLTISGAAAAYYLAESRPGLALLNLALGAYTLHESVEGVMGASHESKIVVGLEHVLAQDALRANSESVFYDQDNPGLA